MLAKDNLHRIYIFLTLRLNQLLLSTSWTVALVTVLVVGSHGADGYAYHNDNAGLTEVPDDIPSTVLTVYLSWNEITDVKPGAFSRLQWCRYILQQKLLTFFHRENTPENCLLVTVRKRSCGKVMFLHLSVILFTGGLCSGVSVRHQTRGLLTSTVMQAHHTANIINIETTLQKIAYLLPPSNEVAGR